MQVKDATLDIIAQVKDLLDQIAPHEYRKPLDEFDGSTLGQHFRHIIEFFVCLERGIPSGIVDYASRERNMLFEDAPGVASDALEHFVAVLPELDIHAKVAFKAEFGGIDRPAYDSTVGRELAFAFDHAIHHLAIIRIGLNCSFPHIRTNRNLGVSPSTIKARQQTGK